MGRQPAALWDHDRVHFATTPWTAALAGAFSAVAWTYLSPLLTDERPIGMVLLIAGTLLLIAAPAHLFVIGVGGGKSFGERSLEPAFQLRLAAWLAAGIATTLLLGLSRRT